ncbi:conserved hypothetical protein [[Clostridium] ultunense Esp]|nr:hypothetical protein [Thermicanus aegyptius]CCQ97269.1 conserved hypothetical protein [[Clostridium] ultunense Esp]
MAYAYAGANTGYPYGVEGGWFAFAVVIYVLLVIILKAGFFGPA